MTTDTLLRSMRPGERAVLRWLVESKGRPVSVDKLSYLTGLAEGTVLRYVLSLQVKHE